MESNERSINYALNGIMGGFVWSETEEGEKYWAEVYLRLMKIGNLNPPWNINTEMKELWESIIATPTGEKNMEQLELFRAGNYWLSMDEIEETGGLR